MNWKEALRRWRAQPEEERQRRRRVGIPRTVAHSMAFDGERVDLALLAVRHARRTILPGRPNRKL